MWSEKICSKGNTVELLAGSAQHYACSALPCSRPSHWQYIQYSSQVVKTDSALQKQEILHLKETACIHIYSYFIYVYFLPMSSLEDGVCVQVHAAHVRWGVVQIKVTRIHPDDERTRGAQHISQRQGAQRNIRARPVEREDHLRKRRMQVWNATWQCCWFISVISKVSTTGSYIILRTNWTGWLLWRRKTWKCPDLIREVRKDLDLSVYIALKCCFVASLSSIFCVFLLVWISK